ncbi:hypothetical protein RB614_18990 [Phytohabitans sp. ZYX-F-186]|uniref:Biotin synthase auxiliary protein n=1 Tax=Phytohabitans maris TaxID=3071409 RepID=A0ABU0ZK24_9ACTN|nr:hypothetical protein [Phytohabitans sp. ZYX-F-186]MDQ7906605.1 hypothetical protein [Phytohabitans sp. ZYX-F-186]
MTGKGDAVTAAALWCDRCGERAAEGDHSACAAARRLEPPRYCPACRRRMKVQVLPAGWSATCVEHGTARSG